MPSQPFKVVAISATFRRPMEMLRLAKSLREMTHPLLAWVVVDNAGDLDTVTIEATLGAPLHAITPGENLGCGGALKVAERKALELFAAEMTHLWILDDDAVIEPGALETMLSAMSEEGAIAAYPAVLDSKGAIAWCPGLLQRSRMMALKKPHTRGEYEEKWGSSPLPFTWAQGIALLVSREGLEKHGLHRTDFWIRGEDLEFSLRLTFQGLGLFVPAAQVWHLPPAATGSQAALAMGEFPKHLALLQNVAYIALRLPHGRRILRTIPGNYLHYFRCFPPTLKTIWKGWVAFWNGGVLGHPAGWKPLPGTT